MKEWFKENWQKLVGGAGAVILALVGFAITWYVGLFTVVAAGLGALAGYAIADKVCE